MNNTGRWICAEVLGCAVCLPSSPNPLCEDCGTTTVRLVCSLLLEQLPPFFLYPFSSKGKRGDVCVCLRWGECSPDRLFSGLKWMGGSTEELSSMGREVEAASAPLFVSTASVLNAQSVEWVKKCNLSSSAFLLSLSASLGSGGGEWEREKGHRLVFFFYY